MCIKCVHVTDADVDRIARMEAEAIDIPAEERRASDNIRHINSRKSQQLKELNSRAKVAILQLARWPLAT